MFAVPPNDKKLNITVDNTVEDGNKVSKINLQLEEENYTAQTTNQSEIADL